MRKLALAFASSILLAFPLTGTADEEIDPFLTTTPEGPPEKGISLGMRLGYGFPMGSATGTAGDDLSASFKGEVPLQLDIGWRFSPKIYAGIYVEYAFASLADAQQDTCKAAGKDCSARDLRFGVDFIYTFSPHAKFIPWAGFGLGYEIAKFTSSLSGAAIDVTFRGFEFLHLMGGVDYRLSPVFRVGPFLNLSVAQYAQVETPVDPVTHVIGATKTYDIDPKGVHAWLQFGVRMTADL